MIIEKQNELFKNLMRYFENNMKIAPRNIIKSQKGYKKHNCG